MGVDYREQYKPEHLEPFFPNVLDSLVLQLLAKLVHAFQPVRQAICRQR